MARPFHSPDDFKTYDSLSMNYQQIVDKACLTWNEFSKNTKLVK